MNWRDWLCWFQHIAEGTTVAEVSDLQAVTVGRFPGGPVLADGAYFLV